MASPTTVEMNISILNVIAASIARYPKATLVPNRVVTAASFIHVRRSFGQVLTKRRSFIVASIIMPSSKTPIQPKKNLIGVLRSQLLKNRIIQLASLSVTDSNPDITIEVPPWQNKASSSWTLLRGFDPAKLEREFFTGHMGLQSVLHSLGEQIFKVTAFMHTDSSPPQSGSGKHIIQQCFLPALHRISLSLLHRAATGLEGSIDVIGA
jgi:hypothetical protein